MHFSDNKEKQIYDNWLAATIDCLHGIKLGSSSQLEMNKNIRVVHIPKGVLVMDIKKIEEINMRLILRAIFEGNTIILLEDSKSICAALSALFPAGVLNICLEVDSIGTISGRQDIHVFKGTEEIYPVFTHLPVQDTNALNYSRPDIFRKVTLTKNIWN